MNKNNPDIEVEKYIVKQYLHYMKKAKRALFKYRYDDDYSKKLRENPYYKKALEWCELQRHYNIMLMKEQNLAQMTKFLREKNMYTEFCHWKAKEDGEE